MPVKDKTAKQLTMEWASQGVFDASEDAISIQDTDFKVLYQNQSHKKMVGEHIGEYCYKGYQRKDSVCENCHLAMSFEDGKVHKKEQVRDTDNGKFYYKITSSPLKDAAGNIIAGMEVVKDISKRKKAEEKLMSSEERFRLAMIGAFDGLWDWDLLTDQVYYSPRWMSMLGYAEEELDNHLNTWVYVVHPDDLEPSLLLINDFLEGRAEKYELEFRMRHKDGHYLNILSRATLVRGADGKALRLVGTHVDITDRKKAELDHLNSEERLSRAQAIAHVGDWEWNITTNAVHWSDELYRIYGFEPRSVAPDYGLILAQMHPESKDKFMDAIDAALKKNRPFDMNYWFFRKDGTEASLHTIGKVIRDDVGAPIRMIGIVQDITESKKSEEELIKYRQHLERLVKERTDEIELQKIALEQKNIALREIIGQIELEKSKIKENILSNIEELIVPVLRKARADGMEKKHIELIEQNLKKVTSSFGVRLSSKKLKLTPREVDVCNMVEKGLTNKEMADLLNISIQSIEGYRKNIRKKLGLSNKKMNLSTYLRNLH